jgi:hypothetical protein
MSKNPERTKFEENLLERNNSRVKVNSEEGRCQCCGKSESEIRGAIEELYCQGETDEIPKDLFVRHARPCGPYWEEAEIACANADEVYKDQGFDDPEEYMVFKYGKEKGTSLFVSFCANHQIGSSVDCLFCCGLDTNEYYEIRWEHFKNP